jgi:hypothetical protein
MIVIVASIRDNVAEIYGRPFFTATVGSAIRAFRDEIQRAAPDNDLYKHPTDFTLYELGTFDDSIGKLTMLAAPHNVAHGTNFITE